MEFNKRALYIFLVVFVLVLLAFVRHVQWQLFLSNEFQFKASNRILKSQYLLGARGSILDRNDVALATNDLTYDLSCVVSYLRLEGVNLSYYRRHLTKLYSDKRYLKDDQFVEEEDKDARLREFSHSIAHSLSALERLIIASPSIARVSSSLDIDPGDLSQALLRVVDNVCKGWDYPWSSVVVCKNIAVANAVKFSSHRFDQGWDITTSLRRVYAYDRPFFHVLGYLRPAFLSDIVLLREQKSIPDFISLNDIDYNYLWNSRSTLLDPLCGAGGAERYLEPRVRGGSGLSTFRRLMDSPEPQEERIPPQNGENVTLTIDNRIQRALYRTLISNPNPAAGVVMDTETGEILALVSTPSTSAKEMTTPALAAEVLKNPEKLLFNRVTHGAYPLGSVFKIVMSAAALEEGYINSDTHMQCDGTLAAPGRAAGFKCFNKLAHGNLDVTEALKMSCNIFYYKMSQQADTARLLHWGEKFGIGRSTGFELGGIKGTLPEIRRLSLLSDRYMYTIGQDKLTASPLHAVRIIAAIANGGKLLQPTLFPVKNHPTYEDLQLSDSTLKIIRNGLWKVVNERSGTAYAGRTQCVEYAGKTGSAEVSNKESHAWFVCYAPFDKPRYAIAVVFENAGCGGKVAAPKVSEVLETIFKLDTPQ